MVSHPKKYPRHRRDVADLITAVRDFVLLGEGPVSPIFAKSDRIWSMGSCFAQNIGKALNDAGANCAVNPIPEFANSSALLSAFIESIASGEPNELIPDAVLEQSKEFISTAKGAILTLGLAAAAFDGEGNITSGRQEDGVWRPLTVAEVTADIASAVWNLKSVAPSIQIILTLSPVPLNRAFWHPSTLIADCVSKSTLRAALSEYMAQETANVYYWPAFEIVRWLGAHRPGHYGADDGQQRHVSSDVVDAIVQLFIERYFK